MRHSSSTEIRGPLSHAQVNRPFRIPDFGLLSDFGNSGFGLRVWSLNLVAAFLTLCSFIPIVRGQTGAVGLFENHSDVGATRRAGSVEHDAARHTYTVAGGGENMWFTNDALHFVWKKVSGDVTLAADIAFFGTGGNAHRKACLLVRQGLESDSAYADAALHGDGLTSLQYRETKGARTYEIQSNASA